MNAVILFIDVFGWDPVVEICSALLFYILGAKII